MTASQPVSADPLAPAKVVPAATSVASPANQPAVAAAGPPAEQPSTKKKRSGAILFVLGGALLLLVVGGAGAAFLFLPKSEPLPMGASTPLLPDPGAPPALPQFVVATATPESIAEIGPKHSAESIQAMTKRLAPRLLVGAGETAAPRELIVRGGSAGDGADFVVPHHQRWELAFPVGMTIESYSRQLDFFRIELGVIGGSPNVTYLSGLANPKPKTRTAAGAADPRIYLIWSRGPMREADEILVARAGLDPTNKVLAHFLPPELEAAMLREEAAAAQANKLTRIRKTVFGIQSVGVDTFRLTVTEQKGE
jgi:hypothetical protein